MGALRRERGGFSTARCGAPCRCGQSRLDGTGRRLGRFGCAVCPAAAVWLLWLVGGCERKRDRPPEVEEIVTPSGIRMVLLPAGEFVMGDDGGEDDEKPAHKVTLSAFAIDKYEVTQKAYEQLMGRNPAKFQSNGDDRPVERMSWRAAAKYCNLRSLAEDLRPCYDPQTFECDFAAGGYRLPTEAEWEYACRAGSDTKYAFGGDPAALGRHAWFKANAGKATHPVGKKQPNRWGLCDMHGNVAEWCNDIYGEAHYRKAAAQDPRGPSSGAKRVLRGGSWRSSASACRSAARKGENPGLADVCFGYEAYGFRCVRRADEATTEK